MKGGIEAHRDVCQRFGDDFRVVSELMFAKVLEKALGWLQSSQRLKVQGHRLYVNGEGWNQSLQSLMLMPSRGSLRLVYGP